MVTNGNARARISKSGKRNLKRLGAIALTTALIGNAAVASAADADLGYAARIAATVRQGKIRQECVPTSAPPADAAYKAPQSPTADLIAAASKEGELILNSGISDQDTVAAFKATFEARYPQIKLTVAAGGSAMFEERMLAEHAAGNNGVDAVISNKQAWVARALKTGTVLPLDKSIPGIFDVWPGGSWTWTSPDGRTAPAFFRSLGIAYNTDLVRGDLVPNEYEDLANPAFKGQLIGLDPDAAVTQARVWKHILDVVGEEKMKAIGANMIRSPLYTDVQPAAQALGAGAGMVAMEMGANVAAAMRKGGAPVKVVMPESTTGTQYAFAAASDGPHPNAARLFGYWLYSAEGQWVMACAAYAGTVAYKGQGSKIFVPIQSVSNAEMKRIKTLLGL